MGRDDASTPTSFPLHIRIRKRREDRGLSGVELAERSGVSPPYVSLIEKGVRVPDEEVAVAIARALDDDEELYRAWARAKRYGGDLESASADLARAYRYSSDRRLRQRISRGDDIDELSDADVRPDPVRSRRPMAFARRLFFRDVASVQEGSDLLDAGDPLISVPVIPAGTDPGNESGSADGPRERSLRLDPRVLEAGLLGAPFAFRATPSTTERVSGEVLPGDWILVDRGARSVDPDAIYAVRIRGGLVLSRVWLKSGALLLPPGPGRSDVEEIELAGGEDASRYLAGRVVAVIRSKI